MKTLTLIFLLFAFKVSAQDSVKINVNVTAKDLEYIGDCLPRSDFYEDLYDVVKKKFRVASTPANNTLVAVDSITVAVWANIMDILRGDPIAIRASVFDRLDVILRAKNNAWLTGYMNEALASDTAEYMKRREDGRRKLSRK